MKEELLEELKKEFINKKREIERYNANVRRVKELEKDDNVKEFLKRTGLKENLSYIRKSDIDIIGGIKDSYIYKNGKNNTNKIYFYYGTFVENKDGGIGYQVNYRNKYAKTRLYYDIENMWPIQVGIEESKEFEANNTIIGTHYGSRMDVNYIQKEFLLEAVEHGQEVAKAKILKKYRRK